MANSNRKRQRPDDWEEIDPSKVIHVRELGEHTLEIDLFKAFENFGSIRDIAMIPKRRQALVEFEDIRSAKDVVEMYRNNYILIAGKPAKVNFSTSEHVVKRNGPQEESISTANNVLIFFIYDAIYPITVEVISKICRPHGRVLRIFINRKAPVLQALVEFYSIEDSIRAKQNLNGADIYSGCCTLKIEFATTNRVNVTKNSEDSIDYEMTNIGERHSLLGMPNGSPPPPQRPGLLDRGGYLPPPSSRRDSFESFPPSRRPYEERSGGNNRMTPMRSLEDRSMSFPRFDMMASKEAESCGPRVAMIYGLNIDKINCDKLFNLLCLYGNVVKIKFLKSKEGSAMVQMGDSLAIDRLLTLMHNNEVFGEKVQFQVSKQSVIMDVPTPYKLPDGTESFKDYTNSRENRFLTQELAEKNRVFPPSKTLNFWNAPPNFSLDKIRDEFRKYSAPEPQDFFQLTNREKSSSGLIQWDNAQDATDAIVLCNHIQINSETFKFPYQLKLSFSESPIRHGPVKTESELNSGSGGGSGSGIAARRGGRGRGSFPPKRGRF